MPPGRTVRRRHFCPWKGSIWKTTSWRHVVCAVKRAPETFDADGFVNLVHRLKNDREDIAYPLFDRGRDCAEPGAGCLRAATPVVVVEGNYLLLRSGPWAALKPLFDATDLIAPPMSVLESRLTDRWLGHGLSREAAIRRVRENDLRNARRVLTHSSDAGLCLTATQRRVQIRQTEPERSRPE